MGVIESTPPLVHTRTLSSSLAQGGCPPSLALSSLAEAVFSQPVTRTYALAEVTSRGMLAVPSNPMERLSTTQQRAYVRTMLTAPPSVFIPDRAVLVNMDKPSNRDWASSHTVRAAFWQCPNCRAVVANTEQSCSQCGVRRSEVSDVVCREEVAAMGAEAAQTVYGRSLQFAQRREQFLGEGVGPPYFPLPKCTRWSISPYLVGNLVVDTAAAVEDVVVVSISIKAPAIRITFWL